MWGFGAYWHLLEEGFEHGIAGQVFHLTPTRFWALGILECNRGGIKERNWEDTFQGSSKDNNSIKDFSHHWARTGRAMSKEMVNIDRGCLRAGR